MKTTLFILLILVVFFSLGGHAQTVSDSIRTRNDKPGTPQSLRSADKSPETHITIINNSGPAVNNSTNQTIVTGNNTNAGIVPTSPITLRTNPVNVADTFAKPPVSKVSNVSNPIRN